MSASNERNISIVEVEDKCLNEIVQTILMLDHSKKPFKPSDISKHLSKKLSRKQWNYALEESKKRLKEMGLTLLETKNTSTRSFILVSSLFPLPSMYKFADMSELADRTLLILVLTFIFMKEGNVTDVDIFSHLRDLNIYDEIKPVHSYFGDVRKKILNEFVSQLYLEKCSDKELDTFEIKWGERAYAEVTKRSILEFVCEIGYEGKIQPKNLASHYRIVLEEENAGNNNGNSREEVIELDS